MKRLFSLLVLSCMLSFCETYAQDQKTNQVVNYQDLTKKQQRQVKRHIRQQVQKQADQLAFTEAVAALKAQNWVLMANTLYGQRGANIQVTDNTNFVQFKDNMVYVQLAFNGFAGPNGLGGVTVQGKPSQIKTTTDKNGNITYSFYVNGIALTAQIVVNLSAGSNYASATVYPMMSGNNLTFSGTLVPTAKSGIFKSGFISY